MAASSLPQPSDQTRLNNVPTRMAKAETASNPPVNTESDLNDRDMLSLIDTARRRAGLKLDHVADLSGITKGQLSGALNGHSGFNARWLWHWPAEFWNEFLPLLRAEKEGTEEARRLQRKERVLAAIEVLFTEVA